MAAKPIKIKINGDADHLKKTLNTAGGQLKKFGKVALLGVGAGVAGMGAAFVAVGRQSEEMTKAIVAGTGATGDALAGLEEDARRTLASVPDGAQAVGEALAEVNTRFGLTGEALSDTSEGFLDFARLAGTDAVAAIGMVDGAMELFGETSGSADEVMGDLLRITQATGLTMDEMSTRLGKVGGTLQALGFNLEESAALLGKMEAAGVDLRKGSAGLEYFADQALAAGLDPQEEWAKLQAQMEGIQDPVEAAALATEALGPSGLAFVTALQDGTLAIEDLVGEGAGLVGEQTEATATLGEKFSELTNTLSVSLMPVAEKLFDAISGGLDKVIPFVQDLSAAFSEEGLSGALRVLREKLAPVEEWIVANKPIIAALAVVVGALLVGAVWSLVAGIVALISPALLVVAALAALAAGAVWAYENVEIFRTIVDKAGEVFMAVFGWLKDNVPPILETVIGVVLRVIGIFWDLQVMVFNIYVAIAGFLIDIVTAVIGFATDVFEAGKDAWNWLSDKFTEAKDLVMTGADAILTFFKELPGKIAEGAGDVFGFLWESFKGAVNLIIRGWNALEFKIPGFDPPGPGPKFGGFTLGLPDIPELATGGVVTSPTLALIGEAGPEAVIPLDKSGLTAGGGGVTVNVSTNADPYLIGREVAWAASHAGF